MDIRHTINIIIHHVLGKYYFHLHLIADWWQASRARVQRLAGRARPTTWSLDPIHASVKILHFPREKESSWLAKFYQRNWPHENHLFGLQNSLFKVVSPQLTSAVRFDIVWDKMLGTQSIHTKRPEVQFGQSFLLLSVVAWQWYFGHPVLQQK